MLSLTAAVVMLPGAGVVLGQDGFPARFRLSGAKQTEPQKTEPPIEVSSNESGGEEKTDVAGPSGPRRAASSGVITGEVAEPKEEPGKKAVALPERSESTVPMPEVVTPPAEDAGTSTEVAARAGFRLNARKPLPGEQGTEPEKAAPRRPSLMGPPDPADLPGGDTPPRRKAELSRTGGGSLGRAISSHLGDETEEALREAARDTELAEDGGTEGLLSDSNPPLHPGPEVQRGQQGFTYSSSDAAEPVPGSSSRVETWADGYFPTQDDNLYIGDLDYPRATGRTGGGGGPGAVAGLGPGPGWYNGPDLRSQNFTGIYPYEDPDETFYDRHGYIFGPLDRGLGFFTGHDALVVENDRLQNFTATLDGSLPTFTSRFNPDRAHFKAGPFYLDILSLGTGLLYSDFRPAEGRPGFAEGEEDGWLGYIDFDVRALLKVTNNFYLSAQSKLVYLPESNKLAFQLGYGSRPAVYFRLNYEDTWGQWDVNFYDEFRGHLGVDLWEEVRSGAVDRAGRYYFGIIDHNNRTNDFFDRGAMYWVNAIVGKATRPLGDDWRLWLQGDHRDFWRGWHFLDHARRDHLGATVSYEGSRLPFAPYVSYDTYTMDAFDSFFHQARIGGRGRLTENLSLNASAGYLWSTSRIPDYETALWKVGLNHQINERTSHGVHGGQDFFVNDFSPETVVADYIGYHIQHQFATNLYGRAYGQWSDEEVIDSREADRLDAKREREIYGAYLDFRPADYTSIRGGAYYQETQYTEGSFKDDRWIYYGMVTQRLFSRTSIWFRYQFEDSDYFDEHLYVTGVRRYF